MKSFFTLLAVGCLTTAGLKAEQVYVFFDPNCSEQVHYEQDYGPGQFVDYYTYHFNLGGEDRLILEVGNQAGQVLNYIPEGTINCGDPRLNRELANRINTKQDEVYIIGWTSQPNTYRVDRVVMAATLELQGNAFSYNSSLTGFQFDADNGIIGENLAYNNPGAKVYFEGKERGICSGTYLFRQLKPNTAYPVIDFKFSPEIGVVERHLGSDGVNSNPGGAIKGKSVNGLDFSLYRQNKCAPQLASSPVTGSTPAAPGTYSNQPVYTPPTVVMPAAPQPESAAAAAVEPTVTTNVVHTVAKGETLYSISGKYSTSVDAIRSTNGLTGNVVYPGQQLTVGTTTAQAVAMAPQPAAANAPQPSTVPTLPYNPGNVASANPGAPQPTPYGAVQEPRSGAAVYGEDLHVVQPGETVASVALKYGYTTAKYREMNNLGPNDVIKVGEQLRTTPCNCPLVSVPGQMSAGPTPAGTEPKSYGTAPAIPQSYSQQPMLAPAVSNAPRPQPSGIPVSGALPTYTPPAELPQAAPIISNTPNFGAVVPNTAAVPTTTLNQLEARSGTAPTTNDPSSFGARPSLPPVTAPAPAPTSYGSTPASPNAFGTPIGAAAATAARTTQPNNRAFHVVQAGETPFAIARRYNLTTAKLRELNNLSPTDVIVPFQKLYVN